MGRGTGRVREVRIGSGGRLEAFISCPPGVIPSPGQYTLAIDQDNFRTVLGIPVFQVSKTTQGFWAVPLCLVSWGLGTDLDLLGPLGHGFDVPGNILRLGLIAVGETVARMMPLIQQATSQHIGVALFTDLAVQMLPVSLEIHPLVTIKDELNWPDFMVFDMPLERLTELRGLLELSDGRGLPCPAQVLLTAPFPCAGMAQCGACAVPARRGWKLACEDGPVFDLNTLKW
jgi:hypothetical protein